MTFKITGVDVWTHEPREIYVDAQTPLAAREIAVTKEGVLPNQIEMMPGRLITPQSLHAPPTAKVPAEEVEEVRCPRCDSNQLSANKKGFGLGIALV